MQITILSVTVEQVPGKKYKKAEVAYRDDTGKVQGKKLMSFVNENVFNVLASSQSGEVFDITSEKDDKGYWQWTAINKADATTPSASGGAKALPSPKSTYETPEERARKQVYIVRQSSLANAIAYYTGADVDVTQIISTAKQFEQYVFDTQEGEDIV